MICNTCKVNKEPEFFSWKNKKLSIRQGKCKSCQKIYASKHYQANKNKYKASAAKSRKAVRDSNKQIILEHLKSNPCVDCGNDDIRVLQFDHRNPEDKFDSVPRLIYSKSLMLAEIEKCDVRCANCHMIRTADQFGWSRN